MNDYTQRIIVQRHATELLRQADNERLARRARVHRDGTVSLARKLVSAATTGFARVGTAARGAAAASRNGLARA